MRRRWLLGFACLAGVAGAGAWVWIYPWAGAPTASPEGAAPEPVEPSAVGVRRVYTLKWSASQSRRFGNAQPIDGELAIDGLLEVIQLADDGPSTRRLARLTELREARLVILGQEVDTAKLHSARARVSLGADGALEFISTAVAAEPAVAHVFWALFSRLQLTTPPRRRETTPLGERNVHYTDRGLLRTRTADRYVTLDGLPRLEQLQQQLSAETRAALLPGGELERLELREELSVVDSEGPVLQAATSMTLELVSTDRVASLPDTHGYVRRDLEAATRRADERGLADRARPVSRKAVVQTLRSFSGPKSMEDLPGWIWAASGRLLLEPSLSQEIATAVASDETHMEGRRLAADLLSGAGHSEAQAGLRDLLNHLREEDSAELTELVQRAGFLTLPDDATIAFVRRLFEEGGADGIRTASAYTLGAMARKLASAGYGAEARELSALLLADFEAAETPEERAAALRAMGNAATPEVVDTIIAQTAAKAPVEREAAAVASRLLEPGLAIPKLIALLVDPSPGVQRAAINSMMGRLGDVDAYAQIRDAVLTDRVHRVNDPLLVNLLAGRTDLPAVRQALEFVLARAAGDPRLRARLRKLLARP